MGTMLILGATSDMAQSAAKKFSEAGWELQLAGRDSAAIKRIAHDLAVRSGREPACLNFEAGKTDARSFWESLPAEPDAIFCAIGLLGDQEKSRHDETLAKEIINANFSGLVPVLSVAADAFEQRGKGVIIGISSVAGDRGRASNYVYGSAKAGFTAFLSGLRNRLAGRGVHVVTVKPGFVATKMTEGMNLPRILTASPDEVADDILKAVKRGADVVYVKSVWKTIMWIIRLMPESVFKKRQL